MPEKQKNKKIRTSRPDGRSFILIPPKHKSVDSPQPAGELGQAGEIPVWSHARNACNTAISTEPTGLPCSVDQEATRQGDADAGNVTVTGIYAPPLASSSAGAEGPRLSGD